MKARDLALMALFAALTAVGAFIKIPFYPVPFTLQFLFAALSGALLGSKKGPVSQAVYVFLGLVGLPIFASGGGPGYVLQPSFGYLLGFILCSFVVGLMFERFPRLTWPLAVLAFLAGMLALFLLGVPYLYLIYTLHLHEVKTVAWAVWIGFLNFAIADVVLSVLGGYLAVRLCRVIPFFRKPGSMNVQKVQK